MPYVFRRPLILLVLAYMAILVVAHFRGWEPAPASRDAARFAAGQTVTVIGRMDREPEFGIGWVRVILRAEKISPARGRWEDVSGKILVQAQRLPFGAGWGDKILLRGKLSPLPSASVPGSFDARIFWGRRGVFSRLSAKARAPSDNRRRRIAAAGRLLEKASIYSPQRWLSVFRQRCLKIYRARLSRPAAELISGLVLGKKPVGLPELDQDFRRSGTYHLLVASGSNVGFIIGLWTLAAWWLLGLPRRLVLIGAIPCAWIYTGMAGLDPPVTRAAVMVTFGLVAMMIERQDRLPQALALSAGLLLALRPSALFEAGFQMSYAATLGIVLGLPALETLVRSQRVWVRWTLAIFFTSFAAQLALSPMLLYYFHRFSWVGLFSNLVAAPLSGICLALGVLLAAADCCRWVWLAHIIGGITDRAAVGLWRIVGFFASVPGAEWTPSWNGRQTAALAVIVMLTYIVWGAIHPAAEESETERRIFRKQWIAVIAIWFFGLPALYAARSKPADGQLSVVWLDAGAGDAQVVTGPGGNVTLVNGGNATFGTYKLVPFLRRRAVAELRGVVLTRADPRHAAGLVAVLQEFPVEEFICPEEVWRNRKMGALRALVEQKKLRLCFMKVGESWTEDNVTWHSLGSAITVQFGTQTALLADDLSLRDQKKLSAMPPLSVLQAPGHGTVEADENFLAAGKPTWIVCSARNLPENFVVPSAAKIFLTGRDGSIEWRGDGKSAECNLLAKPLEYSSQ